IRDRNVTGVQTCALPISSEGPVNAISTCVKGKFGWDFVNSEDRITTPLIRQGDEFVEASWDEALDLVASKLGGIQQQFGPGSVEIGRASCRERVCVCGAE